MSRALLKLLGAAALALPAPAQGVIVGASPLPPASSFGGRTQLYFDYYVVDVQAWDWSFELQLDELNEREASELPGSDPLQETAPK